MRTIFSMLLLCATVMLASCQNDDESTQAAVSGITLNKITLSLVETSKETLIATVAPADAADKSVTWTSDDAGVASVSQTGEVTAVKMGTAIITAISVSDRSKTATCAVTVAAQTVVPAIGDFYMNDGTWVSKDATLTAAQKSACIGIVYWVGDPTAKDATLKKDYPECTHGLVVALGGDLETAWQGNHVSIQAWLNDNKNDQFLPVQTNTNADDPLNNIQGYNNTKAIEAFNATHSGDSVVTAVAKSVIYRTTVIAPAGSSNWYLPSVKELSLLCGNDVGDIWNNKSGTTNRDLINKQLQSIGATELLSSYWYWSSSEDSLSHAFRVLFDDGRVDYGGKNFTFYRVRLSLAF